MPQEKFHYKSLEEVKRRAAELGVDLPFAADTHALAQPLTVRNITFPNRLGIAPMEGADSTPEGAPTEYTTRRYVNEAIGGSSVIWFEAISIVEEGRSSQTQLLLTRATLDEFKKNNPEIFKKDGTLKADFAKAEQVIARIERDPFFMSTLAGEKQVIMTGELFGAKWKIKMDSYIPGVAIVDLKVMASITDLKWVKDIGYLDFVRYWGYDIQGAVYQEIVRQNTGEKLPFFIAGATKQTEPDIRIIHVTDNYLQEALHMVEMNMPRILRVKNGEVEPDRCELCDCCRHNRVLKKPISIMDLTAGI